MYGVRDALALAIVLVSALLVLVVASAVALAIAIWDRLAYPREAKLTEQGPTDLRLRALTDEVEKARLRFASAVRSHDQALESGDRVLAGSALGDQKSAEELDAEREAARQRLKAAQQALDEAQPGHGPDSRVHAWFGSGLMRGWQLGPVGRERFWIRFDHALDPECWVLYSVARWRFGLGLGGEHQRLSLQALRASADQLPILVRTALDGRELALRPGLAPSRLWYRLRRPRSSQVADRALLRRGAVARLVDPPDDAVRSRALIALGHEVGERLDAFDVLPKGPGLLRIVVSGPAWLFGAWSGPAPEVRIHASSGHGTWQR